MLMLRREAGLCAALFVDILIESKVHALPIPAWQCIFYSETVDGDTQQPPHGYIEPSVEALSGHVTVGRLRVGLVLGSTGPISFLIIGRPHRAGNVFCGISDFK